MKGGSYRVGVGILLAAVLVVAIIGLSGLTGFAVNPGKMEIVLDVNKVVPATTVLSIDSASYSLDSQLIGTRVSDGYRIEKLSLDPKNYNLGLGKHTISLVDNGQVLYSAEVEITENVIVVNVL